MTPTALAALSALTLTVGAALALPAAAQPYDRYDRYEGYERPREPYSEKRELYRDAYRDGYIDGRNRPRHRHGRKAQRVPAGCAATIRSSGKRNVFLGFARNSAVFAWQREARAVHGVAYDSWGSARSKSITCDNAGGALQLCTATARPCR